MANAHAYTSAAPNAEPTQLPPTADMRWLWGYVLRHKRAVWRALIFGALTGIVGTAEPFLAGVIVDHLQHGVAMETIVIDIALLIGLGMLTVAGFYGTRFYAGEVAYGVNYDIRRELYDNLLAQDNGFFQQHAIGDLLSRIHADTETIWRLLAIGLTRISSASISILVVFVLLGSINLPLMALTLTVLCVSTVFQVRAGGALTPMFEAVQDQMGTLASVVQDSVSGIQTVKTFGTEASFSSLYEAQSKEYRRRWLFFKRRNEPVGMLPNMISNLTMAVVVFFGGILTVQGAMTLGNFTQYLLYLGGITQALLALGIMYQRFQQTHGAIVRITPLLRPTTIASHGTAVRLSQPQGDIRFEDVGVCVDGRWLLRHVTLHIPAGTVIGIVGATGSGKSLLVNLLARVLDSTEGRIFVDNVDVRDLDLDDLRRAIAYVPQSTFLFSAPLAENIRMGHAEASDDALMRAAEIARVTNDLPQLPQGMDTIVGEKGVMLSGGQKQRVAIARAIVRAPAILILDDALSSVDTRTAADILHGLREVLAARTSLIIAHRIATVKDADRILVIEDGALVEQGTHQELIARDGYYARMASRELAEGLQLPPPLHPEYRNGNHR